MLHELRHGGRPSDSLDLSIFKLLQLSQSRKVHQAILRFIGYGQREGFRTRSFLIGRPFERKVLVD